MTIEQTTYAIAREIVDVSDAVVAAGPPPIPTLHGDFSLRAVDPSGDDPVMLQEWFARPHLAATWEQEWDAARWIDDASYRLAGDYSRPIIFSYKGIDVGYLETYRVARDEIARLYDVHPHDLGFHVATADTELLGRGLVSGLLRELADGMFVADPACRRVAAEPASNNAPIRRALTKRGWRDVGEFQVRPERRIALHLLERPSS
ncbi:GNAT family N-acetyltransferase [Gordonia sp. (in: high G+C Gram-positive bacteria)]|uniref:GNAT family N-acetyltransferase n=1 Tax=Gordonia sp. (in: high G+C Gram-positive bacteria) TaxID=84139 RepID=UPI0016AF5BDE|nr:GNAT family N-acetyltransferase [Gordonia sp. (in: high G+C Gram-positive bacteria)]NLG47934.1 acetyltransferase [Gordonia sp. (in: high G+C Gram-positive bacteria)]